MGNGSGVEPGVLTMEMIEEAAEKALANFGKPNNPLIFMPPSFFSTWEQYPQYRGTPWSNKDRLTKREHAVAGLHTTLNKLGVLKKLTAEDWKDIRDKSVKRLKRAKWART